MNDPLSEPLQDTLPQALQGAARAQGCDAATAARRHLLDGVLRRVAQSPWREGLVLRGSMVARLMCGPTWRPCDDIDFLALWPCDLTTTAARLRDVLALHVADGVTVEADTLQTSTLFADTPSPGLRVRARAHVAGVGPQALQVDVGFDDPLDPPAAWLHYPTQAPALDAAAPPLVLAATPETSFAWKVHGLFEFEGGHWRSKDLHDLYIWSQHAALDRALLLRALRLAFDSRRTPLEATFRLLSGHFGRSRGSRRAWDAFRAERRGRDVPESLDAVVDAVADTLRPLIAALTGRDDTPYVPPAAPPPSALRPGQARRRKASVRRPDIQRESWRPPRDAAPTDDAAQAATPQPQAPQPMHPKRLSIIAHAHHTFYNPISAAAFDRALSLCRALGALPDGARVLDLGAGPAEAALRALALAPGSRAVAVDISPDACAEARRRASACGLTDRLTVTEANAQAVVAAWRAAPREAADPTTELTTDLAPPFEVIFCLGATHSLGGYGCALTAIRDLLRPGGVVVVGEGFWAQPPPPAYLAFLGAQADDYLSHAGNVELAQRCGFTPLYSLTASADDWDHYEGLYAWSVERFCDQHPDDPDAPAMRARIHAWRSAYLTWGRDALGFGLYLLRAPAHDHVHDTVTSP